jgi:hypothetical protein
MSECPALLNRALEITRKSVGEQHPDYATACDTACTYYRATNDLATAQKYASRTLAIREQLLGPDHPDLAAARFAQAEIFRLSGQPERARELYALVLAAQQKTLGPAHPAVADTLSSISAVQAKPKMD